MASFKEIMVIVRPEKAGETEATLLNQGAEYVVRQTVHGRGKEMGNKIIRAWLGSRIKTHPYIRKAQLVALVKDSLVEPICAELIKKNQTGKHGDGKIFIMPAA